MVSAILNLVSKDKPHVVTVISDELSRHLENFNLAHLLEVISDLKTLYLGVAIILSVLKELVLINDFEFLKVDRFSSILIV